MKLRLVKYSPLLAASLFAGQVFAESECPDYIIVFDENFTPYADQIRKCNPEYSGETNYVNEIEPEIFDFQPREPSLDLLPKIVLSSALDNVKYVSDKLKALSSKEGLSDKSLAQLALYRDQLEDAKQLIIGASDQAEHELAIQDDDRNHDILNKHFKQLRNIVSAFEPLNMSVENTTNLFELVEVLGHINMREFEGLQHSPESLIDRYSQVSGIKFFKHRDMQFNSSEICQIHHPFRAAMNPHIYSSMECSENFLLPATVLDLSGSGINLSSLKDSQAKFDINDDCQHEPVSWVKDGTAIMVYDMNATGLVDHSYELAMAHFNGLSSSSNQERLYQLDSNKDGVISDKDMDYNRLFAWVDNGDGISTPDEMFSFESLGISVDISDIAKAYDTDSENVITERFTFYKDGKKLDGANVFLSSTFIN